MRLSNELIAGRWCKCRFIGTVVLLELLAVSLPDCLAQTTHGSGGILHRRRSALTTTDTNTPKRTPALPPSYSPDNDLFYYPFNAAAKLERRSMLAAGVSPLGLTAPVFPWNKAGFADYNEPPQTARNSSVSAPKKYSLEVSSLYEEVAAAPVETALLIAYLPEQATFWVEGTLTRTTGRTRYFQSSPLPPGRKYAYRVQAVWLENGQWVSQTRMVPVQAGMIQAIYLQPLPPAPSKADARHRREVKRIALRRIGHIEPGTVPNRVLQGRSPCQSARLRPRCCCSFSSELLAVRPRIAMTWSSTAALRAA